MPCKTGFDLLWIVADLLSDLLYTWCCFDVSYTCYNNHHLLHNHRCCSVEKFCVYSIRHRQVIFFMFFCRFLNVSRLACKPRAVQLISSSGSRIDSSEKKNKDSKLPILFILSQHDVTNIVNLFKVFFQIVKTVMNKINMIYGFHVGWRVVHVFKEEKPVESILVISITSQVDWQFTW